MSNMSVFLFCVLAILIVYWFNYAPHQMIRVYGIFILFQKLIMDNLAATPSLQVMVQYMDESIILFITIIFFIKQLITRNKFIINGFEVPFLLTVLIGLLSAIWSGTPLVIYAIQIWLFIKGFCFMFILSNTYIDEEELKKYIICFFVIGVIIFICGVVDMVSPYEFRLLINNNTRVIYWKMLVPIPISIFKHPGVFGWFTSFMALFCFAYYIVYQNRKYLWIGGIFALGVLMSMRRKAIAGIIGGLIVGISIQSKKKKLKYAAIFLIMAATTLPMSAPVVSERYEKMVEYYININDSFSNARITLYVTSFHIAYDNFPFGVGFGQFGSFMSKRYYSPVYYEYGVNFVYGLSNELNNYITDTYWPMVLAETGFGGLFLFAWMFYILLKRMFAITRQSSPLIIKAFYLGTLMVFVDSLLESIANSFYIISPFCFFVLGAVGITFSLSSRSKIYTNAR